LKNISGNARKTNGRLIRLKTDKSAVKKHLIFRPHFHVIFLINGDVLFLPILKIF